MADFECSGGGGGYQIQRAIKVQWLQEIVVSHWTVAEEANFVYHVLPCQCYEILMGDSYLLKAIKILSMG
jgi:hypothetical protein